MTPDNALSHLFPGEPRQPRAPEAADAPASVELRPVLQRRIAAPAPRLFDAIDETPPQKPFEPDRETESPIRAHRVPVDTPVKTERIIERVLVEPKTEPPRRALTDDRSAPTSTHEPRAVSGETEGATSEPSRPIDSHSQKTPPVGVAQNAQSRDESPPVAKLSDQPAPVQVRQGARSEKGTDREPSRIQAAQPVSDEPGPKTVVLQPVVHAESPRAPGPAPNSEKSDASPRTEKTEPPDRAVPDKVVTVAPKTEGESKPPIEPPLRQPELKPATPVAAQPSATQTEPVLTPVAQPQSNADSRPARQPSPGGVTVRIGSIQIISRGKSAERPPATRRPARSHKIEPRLPFASGRW